MARSSASVAGRPSRRRQVPLRTTGSAAAAARQGPWPAAARAARCGSGSSAHGTMMRSAPAVGAAALFLEILIRTPPMRTVRLSLRTSAIIKVESGFAMRHTAPLFPQAHVLPNASLSTCVDGLTAGYLLDSWSSWRSHYAQLKLSSAKWPCCLPTRAEPACVACGRTGGSVRAGRRHTGAAGSAAGHARLLRRRRRG